ncbi:MAG: hypothetical protein HRU15_12920 [Planctomycetes bacterium]|nr:hypothetical protein [Planctomycetota bacterium]
MSNKTSGQGAFTFALRDDLYTLPDAVLENEVNLHGGFAIDNREGYGQVYYGMPGSGIMRIESDLSKQEVIALPDNLGELNFHSTKIGTIDGKERLMVAAQGNEKVIVLSLDGDVDYTHNRPEFEEYKNSETAYLPTDTTLVGDTLYIADGYGSNFISSSFTTNQKWKSIFGGIAADDSDDGKFSTAHGINFNPVHKHLDICDRPNSRIQTHNLEGEFLASYKMPKGSFLCGISYFEKEDRTYAVIGCLQDPDKGNGRPAPIYIIDATTYELLSTVRPKEELGVELAEHLHNVVMHVIDGTLYLVCQAWNPGHYFVLQQTLP